jgi:hypothetical protein
MNNSRFLTDTPADVMLSHRPVQALETEKSTIPKKQNPLQMFRIGIGYPEPGNESKEFGQPSILKNSKVN